MPRHNFVGLKIKMIPDDVVWVILQWLPVQSILSMRELSVQFQRVVDGISQMQWKRLHTLRVGTLEASAGFDWKRALLHAERHVSEIEAQCIWNKRRVRLVAPWDKCMEAVALSKDFFIIGAGLRAGVHRVMHHTVVSQGVCIHYVYDEAFELKAIRQTCRKRREKHPCQHCVHRKGCRDQRYAYFLRKLNHPTVNDHLCMRIRRVL